MPIQEKSSLFEIIRTNQEKIRSLGVSRIGIFGSFVREQSRSGSDVDVIVEFERGKKNFDNFIRLSFLLEELFGRKVEVVTPESLSPHIGPYILEEVEYVPLSA